MSEPTPQQRASEVVQEVYARRTWGYDPVQHREFEEGIADAIFAATEALRAEVARLKADNERLTAELKDEKECNSAAMADRLVKICDQHVATINGLRSTVAAREATIALTQEALKLAEMRLTDEARQRTSQAAADLHYAASQCRAALASDAGSSLLAERDRLHAELDDLRAENRRLRDGHWVWQGDGEDYLESLVCNVLIRPEQLSALLARLRSAEAVCEFVDENAPDGHTSECRSVDPIHYAMGCDCWRGQMRELVAAWRKTL